MSKEHPRRRFHYAVAAFGLVAVTARPGWSVTRSDATPQQYLEPTMFLNNEKWSGVGIIRSGSGALISPCHVLTASHVFFGVDGKGKKPPDAKEWKFELVTPDPANPNDASKFKRSFFQAKAIHLGPGYNMELGHRVQKPTKQGDDLKRKDIAIMELEQSVPKEITVEKQQVPIEIYDVNKGEIEKENDPNMKTPAVAAANMVKVGFGGRGNEQGNKIGAGMKGEMFNIIDDFGDGNTTFHFPPNQKDPAIRDNPPPKNTLVYDFDKLPPNGGQPQNSSKLLNTFAGKPGQPSFTVGKFEGSAAGGDSGGPTFQYKDGKKLIVSVTSSGSDGLSRVGTVGYDTQVQAYKDWIARVVGDPKKCPAAKPPDKDEEDNDDDASEFSGYAVGAKGRNGGGPFDAADTGHIPSHGGSLGVEEQTANIPRGCIGDCDGAHPGMNGHLPIHNTVHAGGNTSMSMSSVTFVDVIADGYHIVADWLMPMAMVSCTEHGPELAATTSVGWVLIYDPQGNLIYSETEGLTETVRVPLRQGHDGEVTINEISSSKSRESGTITVNALHVVAGGGVDFVVASAHADVEDCPR